MVKNEIFYYCPDFARNAVNPEPGVKSSLPEEPGGSERPVYVRSARQLNGMSRSTYYWNLRGGGTADPVRPGDGPELSAVHQELLRRDL